LKGGGILGAKPEGAAQHISMGLPIRPEEESPTVSWASLCLAQCRFELVDDEAHEVFRFHKDGFVAATLGVRHGPLTAPILHWRIEGDHLLISFRPDSEILADLHAPKRDGSLLIVKRGACGESRYRITRHGT